MNDLTPSQDRAAAQNRVAVVQDDGLPRGDGPLRMARIVRLFERNTH